MKKLIAIGLVAVFLSSACNKGKDDHGKVNIRIKNSTNLSLEDVKVGDATYGRVTTGMITNYAIITQPVYAGYCSFRIGNQDLGAGYGVCGTPPPPAFPPGFYTFKVEPNIQGYFDVVVIKDR